MASDTPRVPSLYGAIDSTAFERSAGPAFGAHLLDAIEGAHNRLQGAAAHGFALAVPTTAVTYGEASPYRHRTPLGVSWSRVVPPVVWACKPGAQTASFRAEVQLNLTEDADLKIVTEAGEVTTRVTGTGSAQTVSWDAVPIGGGLTSTATLYATSRARGGAASGYGTPVTGNVVSAVMQTNADYGPGQLTCAHATASSDIAWSTTIANAPYDYASQGTSVEITGPSGEVAALLPITSVDVVTNPSGGNLGILTVDNLQRSLVRAIVTRGSDYTFALRTRMTCTLFGLSGATEGRTR